MSEYSLTIQNNSEVDNRTFAVFAKITLDTPTTSFDLAWLTQTINTGNFYTFDWDIKWGLVWSAAGVKEGYRWSAGNAPLPADPSQSAKCAAIFSHDKDFKLAYSERKPDYEHLFITDDGSVPPPSMLPSSVGVTLNGDPTCAMDAGPNLSQTFTLHPTYYLQAGTFKKGQMVDGASVTDFTELKFSGGNRALTATLDKYNIWTVVPTA